MRQLSLQFPEVLFSIKKKGGLKKIIKNTLSGIGFIALFLLFPQNAKATAVSISCAANPTIVQGVDFQTTDDVTLTTSGTCALTTDQTEGGADSYVSMASLTIETGVTLTHAVSGTTASHHNELDLHLTGDLTLNGTGSINVAGKGYNGGASSGSTYGYTNGNTSTGGSYIYAGGSHGGRGGHTSTYTIAAAYDSIINPALPGGGGGGTCPSPGEDGGNGCPTGATGIICGCAGAVAYCGLACKV